MKYSYGKLRLEEQQLIDFIESLKLKADNLPVDFLCSKIETITSGNAHTKNKAKFYLRHWNRGDAGEYDKSRLRMLKRAIVYTSETNDWSEIESQLKYLW